MQDTHTLSKEVKMTTLSIDNESWFKISNHDAMRPFFMSIVSDSNHWMFISSNGGLTAGRKNSEYALFPYYTDDKITESADITGSKTLFQVKTEKGIELWEPFSERYTEKYHISRNVYKNIYGNKILFEEVNHDLGLVFKYQWNSGKVFGFIRKAELLNTSDKKYDITLLDGIQNIMPYGVPSDLQGSTSNLVDAYKRNEQEPATGIGIFALSAIIVDRAEPSEALKANIAWHFGLEKPKVLLSSAQLQAFRQKQAVSEEKEVKGEKGAYFVSTRIVLPAKSSQKWNIIADVNRNHSQIVALSRSIRLGEALEKTIQYDIDSGTENLIRLVSEADGFQFTADALNDARHFSNVLFNIMRGGIFDDHYQITQKDFVQYLNKANKEVTLRNPEFVQGLKEEFSLFELRERLLQSEDVDLVRLGIEYLPLKFSRRHGDPSRPWNFFSINIQNEIDGSEILDYQGNWRDIFQNWEALACSYPEFMEGMIFKFLNASTFDGYNPYRVTKDGFDWETIEPDNPWSYIGYWGDHQIIYLQKFLEIMEKHRPGALQSWFSKDYFVYAAVPYIIKPYEDILKNPKDTIVFDESWDKQLRGERDIKGADGALLGAGEKKVYHINFLEKILATSLAKISNLIPEAGIWLNTQRPEWNDANNALVGNGVSMVTLYYLHRFMKFLHQMMVGQEEQKVLLSCELIEFYNSVKSSLQKHKGLLSDTISDRDRKNIMDDLGQAASDYRQNIYQNGFSGKRCEVLNQDIKEFTEVCLEYIKHSIDANKREDNLYHAYNLISIEENEVSIDYLNEMLEGQVAVLSSGYLNAHESLTVLDALKNSALYREDQYTYILYPNKDLPGFMQKNTISQTDVESSELLKKLIAEGNKYIVEKDAEGEIHFHGDFRNASDLENALLLLSEDAYQALVEREKKLVLQIFEKVFNHKAFTGRSGTFFAFEGLGSIYWHMVSKLLLATQECCLKAVEEKADPVILGRLLDHYYEIQAGIGVHKSPELYGAFPTDPYSHTPQHRGAQQPGMTGQVKEDVLARFGELGVFASGGKLHFSPCLLRKAEFLQKEERIAFHDIHKNTYSLDLKNNSLAFTYCQVPVIYEIGEKEGIEAAFSHGEVKEWDSLSLDEDTSRSIFSRTGQVKHLKVMIKKSDLK